MNKALYLAGFCAAIVMLASGYGALRANVTPPPTRYTARSKRSTSPPKRARSSTPPRNISKRRLDPRRREFSFQQRRPHLRIPVAGGEPERHRHRLRHPVQQRPRRLAGRDPAGHQRSVAGRGAVAHLHAADHRRRPKSHHADRPLLLARLVARWQDAGLLRPAQRRLRHLHHSRRRRQERA